MNRGSPGLFRRRSRKEKGAEFLLRIALLANTHSDRSHSPTNTRSYLHVLVFAISFDYNIICSTFYSLLVFLQKSSVVSCRFRDQQVCSCQ